MRRAPALEGVDLRHGDAVTVDARVEWALRRVELSEVDEVLLEEVPDVTFEDIGGLGPQIERIREAVEIPFLHPEVYREHGLRAPKGIMLYGPPGTGKTMLAKAVANALSARSADGERSFFLNVKGPELLNKYVGETERQIRVIFDRAREKADAGFDWKKPKPAPQTAMRQMTSNFDASGSRKLSAIRPQANRLRPIAPRTPAEYRSDSQPARGAATMVASGQGVMRRPVSTALSPNDPCRKNGRATKAIIWAVKDMTDVATDRANIGRARRSSGISGAARGFSCLTRSTPAARPAPVRLKPSTDASPCAKACRPVMTSPNAAALNAARPVQRSLLKRIVRQGEARQRHRQEADGNVQGEEPAPMAHG